MDQKAAEEDEEASVLPRRKNFRARRAGKTADRSGLKTQGVPDTGEVNESIDGDDRPQGQHQYQQRRFKIRK